MTSSASSDVNSFCCCSIIAISASISSNLRNSASMSSIVGSLSASSSSSSEISSSKDSTFSGCFSFFDEIVSDSLITSDPASFTSSDLTFDASEVTSSTPSNLERYSSRRCPTLVKSSSVMGRPSSSFSSRSTDTADFAVYLSTISSAVPTYSGPSSMNSSSSSFDISFLGFSGWEYFDTKLAQIPSLSLLLDSDTSSNSSSVVDISGFSGSSSGGSGGLGRSGVSGIEDRTPM